jgi:Carboxypeptidase regulatory-like domain
MSVFRIVLLILSVQLLSAQQPPPTSVQGVVVRFESEDPLVGATVELRPDSGVVVSTTTDRDGRFIIPNLQPGEYRLFASRSGYVRAEYGQKSAGSLGKPLVLRAGERLAQLRLAMTPGGVITGRVMNQGKPAAGVTVAAGISVFAPDGQRTWKTILSGQTNDLGEYSIFWLPAGRYYVMVDVGDVQRLPPPFVIMNPGGGDNPLISRGGVALVGMSRPGPNLLGPAFSKSRGVSDIEMHVPIFSPATPDWREANPIEITTGSEVRNVDIDMSPLPALHVRGTVTGLPTNAQGQPALGQITLLEADSPSGIVIASTQWDSAGNFDLPRVSRGSYLLRANTGGGARGLGAAATLTGRASVDVRDRDISITVALAPGFTVSGRVVLEQPEMAQGNLTVEVVDGRGGRTLARPAADGSFTIANRVPGESYRVFVSPIFPPLGVGQGLRLTQTPEAIPPAFRLPSMTNTALQTPAVIPPQLRNAYVKSIMMGSTDVLNDGLLLTGQPQSPLVITIGANAGSLEGNVFNSGQPRRPVGAATVVLIQENGQRFHVNHNFAISDDSGGFRIPRIPPGDYRIFAWESIEPGAWQNADFVKTYESRGTPVRVNEGGRVTIDVTSIP